MPLVVTSPNLLTRFWSRVTRRPSALAAALSDPPSSPVAYSAEVIRTLQDAYATAPPPVLPPTDPETAHWEQFRRGLLFGVHSGDMPNYAPRNVPDHRCSSG